MFTACNIAWPQRLDIPFGVHDTHSIALFVSQPAICTGLSLEVGASRCVPLGNGLCGVLLFAPDGDSAFSLEIPDELCAFPEFQCLTAVWAAAAACGSHCAKIAYVETEYFGGEGVQAAVVWEHGNVVAGPSVARSGPINSALRSLGVQAQGGIDEFDAVGFGAVRSNSDFTK